MSRTLLIGEAPPRAGLGPLGAFDCASGQQLARIDPHHDGVPIARPHVADTLGLFDRANLLPDNPGKREADGSANNGDRFPHLEAVDAARVLLPTWEGRRVALAGRRVAKAVAQAGGPEWAGVDAAPSCRWVQMGGPGEPLEVCVIPHPSPTNRGLNPGEPARERLALWLAAERARVKADGAWIRLDASTAYRFSDGAFLCDADQTAPEWRAKVIDLLARNCSGVGRFSGPGLPVTAHHLLTADLAVRLHPGPITEAHALTHDLHEGLVHDVATPFKRRHPSYCADERTAVAAVARVLGLPPAPAAVVAAVHKADMLAREAEAAHLFGAPFGDVEWPSADDFPSFERALAEVSRLNMCRRRDLLTAEWADRLAAALADTGLPFYQEHTRAC